jgi:hypothetical protein
MGPGEVKADITGYTGGYGDTEEMPGTGARARTPGRPGLPGRGYGCGWRSWDRRNAEP